MFEQKNINESKEKQDSLIKRPWMTPEIKEESIDTTEASGNLGSSDAGVYS